MPVNITAAPQLCARRDGGAISHTEALTLTGRPSTWGVMIRPTPNRYTRIGPLKHKDNIYGKHSAGSGRYTKANNG